MSEQAEAQVVGYLAQQAMTPKLVEAGQLYAVPNDDGGLRILDTDTYGETPRRATGNRNLTDAESFVDYVKKHGLEQSEIYADSKNNRVIVVIDSHAGAEADAGWQGHKATLTLEHTTSWEAWIGHNNKWFSQVEFAEFIEQHAVDVAEPSAGDLMSLAQNFYMTKGVEYESSERLADGQTNLVYKEKVESRGLGSIEVPKQLKLALQPYTNGPRQFGFASFRTRLNGAQLQIGYVMIRPEEILEGMFTDIVEHIKTNVTQPIYFGRP